MCGEPQLPSPGTKLGITDLPIAPYEIRIPAGPATRSRAMFAVSDLFGSEGAAMGVRVTVRACEQVGSLRRLHPGICIRGPTSTTSKTCGRR